MADGGTYFSKQISITDSGGGFRNTITIDENLVGEVLSKREIEILTAIAFMIKRTANRRLMFNNKLIIKQNVRWPN